MGSDLLGLSQSVVRSGINSTGCLLPAISIATDKNKLKSERGLPALSKLFTDVRFAGRGHEAEDLKLLMSRLEHWAHRLFPKMVFDDFIERLEKLGSKKEIMTCVKRIRLDMPVADSEFVSQTVDDIDEPTTDNVMTAEEAFDELVRSESERDAVDASRSPDVMYTTPNRQHTPSHSNDMSLSVEQRERMERSRQLALQRRASRLGAVAAADANRSDTVINTDASLAHTGTDSRPVTDGGNDSQQSLARDTSDVMCTAENILDELETD